jgi:hypothetical protein
MQHRVRLLRDAPVVQLAGDNALKQHPVWVRIPPGARFFSWFVGASLHDPCMYPTSLRSDAVALVRAVRSRNSVSKQLGVSRAALRSWLDAGVEPKCPPHSCFVCDERAPENPEAYALLFGYYLGEGCISRNRRTFILRISCDRGYPKIIEDVAAAVAAVSARGQPTRVDAPGVVVVHKAWQHWPCVFPQHGPGPRHNRRLVLQQSWRAKRGGTTIRAGSSPTTPPTSWSGVRTRSICWRSHGASRTGRPCPFRRGRESRASTT